MMQVGESGFTVFFNYAINNGFEIRLQVETSSDSHKELETSFVVIS